ncbi:MAG: helix-turn-helix domain-containing protein [Verrucomicrobia bacterium]|nr:helix-turn-helix domain-containing protein [Verrucomicrobiota bacterium]
MEIQLAIPPRLDGELWRRTFTGDGPIQVPIHRHAELEINLVTRGSGVYLIDENKVTMSVHTQLWLFPAQNHVLLEISPTFEMWILVFKPELVERHCTAPSTRLLCNPMPSGPTVRQLPDAQALHLQHLFKSVLQSRNDPPRFNAGLGYAMLEAWFAQLAANVAPVVDHIHPAIERTVERLRDDHAPSSLSDLARQANVSPSHLSRLFKSQTGLSLVDFRNRQRIERFLTYYGLGQRRTMLDAALAAGFGSYAQFHRVFKQVMHLSPQAWRRRIAAATVMQKTD